jgi:hypothetical protein
MSSLRITPSCRRATVLLATFALLFAPSALPAATSKSPTAFNCPSGYTLTIPAGWYVEAPWREADAQLTLPGQSPDSVAIRLFTVNRSDSLTLEQHFAQDKQMDSSMSMTVRASGFSGLGGMKAYYILATYPDPITGATAAVYTVTAFHKTKACYITLNCPAESYNTLRIGFEAMLRSLKFSA